MSSLHVHQLVVSRGDRTVLDDLSFSVAAGEVLHIRGRNGAGKTSLLEVLCGLRAASGGRIEQQPAPSERHWIGHKNGLNPVLSALENLQFWAGLNGVTLRDPRGALASVGLKAQALRPAGTLSTGQKRRAALARLVAAPRPWWFLDEPLAGLDLEGLDVFARLVISQVSGGGTVIVTSHQPLPGEIPGLRALSLTP